MKKFLLSALLAAASVAAGAQTARQFTLPLSDDGVAQLVVYLPEQPTGRAVVCCPGGGYAVLSNTHEGAAWSEFFNAKGIAFALVNYRIPHAGGHLASTIATHTPYELRPDFQILVYPVITMGPGTHQGSLDGLLGDEQKNPDLVRLYSNQFQVKTHQTPPAIIILSDDDGLVPPVPNAIAYYSAMHNEGISCSLHVYPSGGHGYGYMPFFAYREQMLSDLSAWLDKLPAPAPDAIKVACIGDSITDGHGIDLRDVNGYPAQMQKMLGDRYNVRNFGISARTLMNSGDLPYMNEGIWHDALAFQPDIVVIMLGTNDSKEYNWAHKKDFAGDLKKMLDALKALPTQPKIYLCKPIPALKDSWTISESVITGEIVPLLEKAVKKEKLEGMIDLHTALEGHPEMMQDDGIHPNAAGVRKMAETVAKVIDPEVKIPERSMWMRH